MPTFALADTFEVTSPRRLTAANWWADGTDHTDLEIEPLPLEAADWAALARLASVPVHPVLATTGPDTIRGHQDAEEADPATCLRLTDAVDAYWMLHGPGFEAVVGHRYALHDDGLLIADGRAWPLVRVTLPSADADAVLERLADHAGAVVLDDWEEDPASDEATTGPVVIAQVGVPFTEHSHAALDGFLAATVTGSPPRGRPHQYLVHPAPSGARVFAATPVLGSGTALRAVLTCRDETAAFDLAMLLNLLADPTGPQPDTGHVCTYGDQVLTPSSARALRAEVGLLTGDLS